MALALRLIKAGGMWLKSPLRFSQPPFDSKGGEDLFSCPAEMNEGEVAPFVIKGGRQVEAPA